MPYESQLPVERVRAAKETEHGRPARREFVHRNGQADIAAGVFEARLQSVNGVVAPSGGGVYFGEIQVELSLIALHANGGIAQPFRFAPFAFGARQHDAKV